MPRHRTPSANTKMRADAWISELDARIAARAAEIAKRSRNLTILLLSCGLALLGIAWFDGIETALAAFLLMLIPLVMLGDRSPPYQELRRYTLPRSLLVWLSNELKPKSTVKWAIDPVIPPASLQQRWLDGSFVLMDGTLVALRIELDIKAKHKQKRKGVKVTYKVRELLSVQMTLPEAPSPARLKAAKAHLSKQGPVPLIRLEAQGRRIHARFTTGVGRMLRAIFVGGGSDSQGGAFAGTLQPHEVMNCVTQLFTLLRPQSQGDAG